jgi:arylsulfatase A-like enzyme
MAAMRSLIGAGILACTLVLHGQGAERLNILFAFADDWGRYASAYSPVDGGATPSDVVTTPHFDRVAREGVLFKNAFVTAPSCTPCRSSLLSGQYFFRTGRGAILQGAQWDNSIPSFPLLLREAGYHIGETYKVWTPGRPADAPYGAGKYAYEKAGRDFNRFSQTVTKMVRNGESIQTAKDVLYDEVRKNFEMFLAQRPEGKPFCYWFGPTLVHRKWIKGSGKTLWGIDPDSLKGKLPVFLPDEHEVRQDFADYLGEVQAFDAGLGVILKKLAEVGELDNTVVVVSGDHGAPGFPRGKCNLYDFGVSVPLAVWWPGTPGGRVVDDFVNLMDLAPTFLDIGGVNTPGVMTGRSLVNVLKSEKQGLVDSRRTWVITGRERHVRKARADLMPYPQRALRTEEYLYIINFKPDRWPMGDPYMIADGEEPEYAALENNTFVTFGDLDASPTKAWVVAHRAEPKQKKYYDYAFARRPREELYVMTDDRDQVSNVAGEPRYRAVREKLQRQLLDELKRMKDPRVLGDGGTFDRSPYAD